MRGVVVPGDPRLLLRTMFPKMLRSPLLMLLVPPPLKAEFPKTLLSFHIPWSPPLLYKGYD